ncbi:MAG TPA: DNA ligase, partial [Firmicutes bacterium]|nr:DNA ligase [Bacillota bacterium]
MDKLEKYHKKRSFNKTSEPKGKVNRKKNKNNIFVVQHHASRKDHYDFRLEYKGVLVSWAVPKGPSFNPQDKRLAVKVEDHPLEYKDFEGVIPKGEYGGGTVMLFDEGEYEPLNDFKKGLKKGMIKFILNGKRLKGKWALIRIKESEDNWLLIKEKDSY